MLQLGSDLNTDRRVLERKSYRRTRRGVKPQEVGGENTAISHSATVAPGPLGS